MALKNKWFFKNKLWSKINVTVFYPITLYGIKYKSFYNTL